MHSTHRLARFSLVRAGHHFVLQCVPPRPPRAHDALTTFIRHIDTCRLPPADIDAVLLRCLMVLARHVRERLPSPIERYLCDELSPLKCAARFVACAEELLHDPEVPADPLVRAAIDIIDHDYQQSSLRQRSIAESLAVTPTVLSIAFKRATGITVRGYLRRVRMSRAVAMLAETNKSIKEVWACLGYNHASNFNHDFRRQFGVPPQQYRRVMQSGQSRSGDRHREASGSSVSTERNHRVMIVDADATSRTLAGEFLRHKGWAVSEAACAEQALREATRVVPDVILLEYFLDDMDGIECVRALRSHLSAQRTAVAFLSADWDVYEHVDEIDELESIIVAKPCDLDHIDQLVVSLSRHGSNHPWLEVGRRDRPS